jgi:hypothetical protein
MSNYIIYTDLKELHRALHEEVCKRLNSNKVYLKNTLEFTIQAYLDDDGSYLVPEQYDPNIFAGNVIKLMAKSKKCKQNRLPPSAIGKFSSTENFTLKTYLFIVPKKRSKKVDELGKLQTIYYSINYSPIIKSLNENASAINASEALPEIREEVKKKTDQFLDKRGYDQKKEKSIWQIATERDEEIKKKEEST